jgi:predicted ATPase
VTLTGPGGTGKTRLAAHVAAELLDEFADGVFFVNLAALTDPGLVLPTVARTLGLAEAAGGTVPEQLVRHLRGRRVLLFIDNAEHVLAAAPAIAELAAASVGARVLVTSRVPLGLRSETTYAVAPLPTPSGVALFTSCARTIQPEFDVTPANASTVADICATVDGLPLAIELAAARISVLPPAALLPRLDRRLQLLKRRAPDAPERHRGLRAAIDWSYDLLNPNEQRLFARLAVFAGGCALDAAEGVCGVDLDVVDGFSSLVDASLVLVGGSAAEPRFAMLETIREYAAELLDGSGEDQELKRRHMAYYLAGAEANGTEHFQPPDHDQVDWFESEQANLRVALDWFDDHEAEPELRVRLTVACGGFWEQCGHWPEGRQRTEAALGHSGEVAPPLRARLLCQTSRFASREGDYSRGKELAQAAIALRLETSPRQLINAYCQLGFAEEMLGDLERAVKAYEEMASLARASGNEVSLAVSLHNIGLTALHVGDFTRSRSCLEESIAVFRRLNEGSNLANGLCDLGFLALAENHLDEAAAALGESLRLARAERFADCVRCAVEGLASIALERAEPAEAIRLLGATSRSRAAFAFGEGWYPIANESRSRTLDAARVKLGQTAFAAALAEGEALSIEEAADAAALIR